MFFFCNFCSYGNCLCSQYVHFVSFLRSIDAFYLSTGCSQRYLSCCQRGADLPWYSHRHLNWTAASCNHLDLRSSWHVRFYHRRNFRGFDSRPISRNSTRALCLWDWESSPNAFSPVAACSNGSTHASKCTLTCSSRG